MSKELELIAAALAEFDTDYFHDWRPAAAHVVEMLSEHGYSIVQLPKPVPDDTAHPHWAVEDVSGPQVVRVVGATPSIADLVSIEFTARYRWVTPEAARELAAALLAAAAAAEEDQ